MFSDIHFLLQESSPPPPKHLQSSNFCNWEYFIPSFCITPIHFTIWYQSSHQRDILGVKGRILISNEHPYTTQVWCQCLWSFSVFQIQEMVLALITCSFLQSCCDCTAVWTPSSLSEGWSSLHEGQSQWLGPWFDFLSSDLLSFIPYISEAFLHGIFILLNLLEFR